MRHGFVDERAMIATTLKSSCHYKLLAHFCLRKERPETTFLTLTVNYHKSRTEKQIMPSKATVKWLFNDLWCYLPIACFDWKIAVFQQTVVKV